MKASLLIYSAWISLLLIAGVSCRSARVSYSGMPFEVGSSEKMTLKTEITWGEREISGLMLIKKTEDGNLKIAFYNELGMTYLEGLLDRSSKHPKLIVKNIAPAIDYKPFIKNFERCFYEICKLGTISIKSGETWDADNKNITVELNNGFTMNFTIMQ
jgi:hypothetical protein